MCNEAGRYAWERARYIDAELLLQSSLKFRKKIGVGVHPDVGESLNNLAGLYYDQRRPAEAEELYRRALEISEQAGDPIIPMSPPPSTTWH